MLSHGKHDKADFMMPAQEIEIQINETAFKLSTAQEPCNFK